MEVSFPPLRDRISASPTRCSTLAGRMYPDNLMATALRAEGMSTAPRDKELAQDPTTSLEELRRIVRNCVDLRPDMYANPACPEQIREWIRSESPAEARAGERILRARET